MLERKQIGVIGVDSGQLMICDPCYVDCEWQEEEYDIKREYRIKKTGKIIDMAEHLDHGRTYESPLDELNGLTMNEAVKQEHVEEIPTKQTGHFSYDGICRVTGTEDGGGQLNYKKGHPGVAVACSTGYGDGCYPVYAEYNEEGRIAKIIIETITKVSKEEAESLGLTE